ncbi:hypothetical protein ACA30_13245 [Virgibacillus soli]|nr:hypothetical protein ACA30_13245 [Virgibacillus soli]
MTAMNIAGSPFSLAHSWTLHWERLPSNLKRMEYFSANSNKEKRAVDAISKVGVIGGQQLHQLFNIDKKRLKRMIADQKIVRHEMRLVGKIIPIYTLGINGAVMMNMQESYQLNYWVEYKAEDVLKRMLFFRLYQHFFEKQENTHGSSSMIIPTPNPFIGAIEFNQAPLYVYVVRGDTNDFLMYLKWKNKPFNERLIVIAEEIRHLEILRASLQPLKVRVALDRDLLQETKHVQNLFYFLKDGEFIREH